MRMKKEGIWKAAVPLQTFWREARQLFLHFGLSEIPRQGSLRALTAFFIASRGRNVMGLAPKNPPGDSVRETRIVAAQVSLLAVFDAPPAFIAHRARCAPVP